jgi:hypothetical protein
VSAQAVDATLAWSLSAGVWNPKVFLGLVATGNSNREIGKNLQISTRPVEGHRARAMMKLDLSSVADLVKNALRKNLISAVVMMAYCLSTFAAFD